MPRHSPLGARTGRTPPLEVVTRCMSRFGVAKGHRFPLGVVTQYRPLIGTSMKDTIRRGLMKYRSLREMGMEYKSLLEMKCMNLRHHARVNPPPSSGPQNLAKHSRAVSPQGQTPKCGERPRPGMQWMASQDRSQAGNCGGSVREDVLL